MRALQLFWHKSRLQDRYIVEISIFEIGDPVRYPDGVKFGLICFDLITNKRVLIDNHHPKGPHIHLDNIEVEYLFKDVPTLMSDFKHLVFKHLEVKL
jgi:hypothetical protein